MGPPSGVLWTARLLVQNKQAGANPGYLVNTPWSSMVSPGDRIHSPFEFRFSIAAIRVHILYVEPGAYSAPKARLKKGLYSLLTISSQSWFMVARL